jgi:effector-binding domain-containing protein
MEKTYAELQEWMAEQGLRPATLMWECYLSDPRAEPDPAAWRTEIFWPLL